MREKIFLYIYNHIKNNSILFITVALLLLTIFLLAYFYIPLKSDYIDLLPQDLEAVKKIKILSNKLKGVGQLSIVIQSEKKDVNSMIKISDLLYEKIKDFPEIDYINYKIAESFKRALFLFVDIDDLKEIYRRVYEKVQFELLLNSAFNLGLEEAGDVEFNINDIIDKYKNRSGAISIYESNYFISKDKDILVMFLKPKFMASDIEKTERLMTKIKRIVSDIIVKDLSSDLSISFGGTYVLTYDQKTAIADDIKKTSLIAIAIIFIVIIISVKSFRYSIFLLLSLFIGVMSTFALAFIFFNHINLITGFLIALLTGLGVNYGTHFILRYTEELNSGNSDDPLKVAFSKTIVASLTGALTTSVAFFTLFFSKFLGFSEFGLLSSFGVMITLFATYLFVSAFIIFTDRFFKKSFKIGSNREKLKNFNSDTNLAIFSLFIIALFFLAILMTAIFSNRIKYIEFEYDSKKLEVKDQESIKTTELIQKKFNVSTDPAIYFTENRDEEMDFFNTVNKLKKNSDSMIGSIMTISSILNDLDLQKEKIAIINKIRKELKNLPLSAIKDQNIRKFLKEFLSGSENLSVITENDMPFEIKKRFMYVDENSKLYISQVFPNKVLFDARDMKKYVDEIKEIRGEKGIYKTTGMHILYVHLIDIVLRESKIFILVVFLIIWLMLFLDFKNIKDSIICMVPLIFAFIWLLIIMASLKIKFNFMNIIVLPTILGTGVDNSIHLYHRYKESKNIFCSLRSTGKANFIMSLTVAVGWSSLFFARYEGLKTMALLGSIGIMLTFFASLIFIPAVVLIRDFFFLKKRAF